MVARRDQIPPDAPCEPVGTRSGALHMPTTAGIERSQVGQQPVGGCIEVRRLLGDPLAQLFELIHDNRISSWSDIEPAPNGTHRSLHRPVWPSVAQQTIMVSRSLLL